MRLYGNSTIGGLVSSAIFIQAKEKFGDEIRALLINGGLIRAQINSGTITYGTLYSILPFGNDLVTFRLNGSEIRKILQYGTDSYKKTPQGHLSLFAGLTIKVNTKEDVNSENRITDMAFVNEKGEKIEDVDPDKEYVIATDDFISGGGDGYKMFFDYQSKKIANHGPLLDLLEQFINKTSPITGNEEYLHYARFTDDVVETVK